MAALGAQITRDRPLQPSCRERIEKVLAEAEKPLSHKQICNTVHVRASEVSKAMVALVADGRVIRTADGYLLAARQT